MLRKLTRNNNSGGNNGIIGVNSTNINGNIVNIEDIVDIDAIIGGNISINAIIIK